MVSASHNPFYDNGIKIFKSDGFKPSDEKEAEIEQFVLNENLDLSTKAIHDTGRVYAMADSGKRYANFLEFDYNKINLIIRINDYIPPKAG